jgi:hypothetical protein
MMHGLFRAAMNAAVGLLVACQPLGPQSQRAVDWVFVDAAELVAAGQGGGPARQQDDARHAFPPAAMAPS